MEVVLVTEDDVDTGRGVTLAVDRDDREEPPNEPVATSTATVTPTSIATAEMRRR